MIVTIPKPVVSSYVTVSCSSVYLLAVNRSAQRLVNVSQEIDVLINVRNWGASRKLDETAAVLHGMEAREREACLRTESILEDVGEKMEVICNFVTMSSDASRAEDPGLRAVCRFTARTLS